MGIRVVCGCGPRVLKDHLAGERIQCPRCLMKIDVPALPPPPPRLPANAPVGNFPSLDEAPPLVPLLDDPAPEALLDEPFVPESAPPIRRRRRSRLKVLLVLLVLGFLGAGAAVWYFLGARGVPTVVLKAGEQLTLKQKAIQGKENATICVVCIGADVIKPATNKDGDNQTDGEGLGTMRWSTGESTRAVAASVVHTGPDSGGGKVETLVVFPGPVNANPVECRVGGKKYSCKVMPVADFHKQVRLH